MNDLIGHTLGQYRVLERIGEGGMATVYKGYQPSLNRYVAVKVLPPIHAKQPGFSERFRREAEAVANLNHPNILPVFDFGQEEGYSFIAMRFVDGARTLREVIETPLSLAQVADLIGQIASALDHAHGQGVIHRDVKPSNVLMDGDWALLTDFGLAKMTEASMKLTGSGVGIGTPAYMSPEQGQGLEIDHRTDIYSLGIILFEMLTGQIPHDAETPLAIVLKRITEPLPLPCAINPDIPESVERVVLKALAREPGDRFASAGEMVEAFKQAIGEATTVERPPLQREVEALPSVAQKPASRQPPEMPISGSLEAAQAAVSLPARSPFPWKWVAGVGAAVLVIALVAVGLGSGLVRIGRPTAVLTTSAVAGLAPTALPTSTPTDNPGSPVPTAAATPTDAPSPLPTATHTPTHTPSPLPTATHTPTDTPSPLPTATHTPTHTPSPMAVRDRPPKLGYSWTRPTDGMVMVYVPAGELWMGSDDSEPGAGDSEKPRHKVHVEAFWIDRTEVTNAQYKQCVDAGACSPPQVQGSTPYDRYYTSRAYDDYPVAWVTSYQAQAYAEWVGGRLPSEAEWEYAARGPDGHTYPWGDRAPNGSLLNYDDEIGGTMKVSSYPDGASWCGALNMAGNVWEWTRSLTTQETAERTWTRQTIGTVLLAVGRTVTPVIAFAAHSGPIAARTPGCPVVGFV